MIARITALLLTAAAAVVRGETPDFNRDIRPILSNNCFQCHGPDEKERKGGEHGLRLDTAEGAAADLGGYPAIVPGKPEKSELVRRITTDDKDDHMPPAKTGKKLTAREIGLLREWIKGGGKYSKHWAYEPPSRPAVPDVAALVKARADLPAGTARALASAATNPIDAFILKRLAAEKLTPQPEADRHTLARRVTLDLTGLPPSPEEVDVFVKDTTPGAYERFVDAQLAKPAYGEHWGRQWLDLARYADSAGYADDPSRKIWGFRDYVIRSFNANKPFDQFTIEQIAGDLLPDATEEQLVATAFHRNTMTNSEGGTQDEEFRNAAIVDRANTTMAVWMGTSFACAQCHTHKFDPISHKEYFKMFAFFNNTEDADRRDEAPLLKFLAESQRQQRAAWEREIAETEAKLKSSSPALAAAAEKWAKEFPVKLEWRAARPAAARSASGVALTIGADGAMLAAKNDGKTDTYTIEVPVAQAQTLSALRLEALTHESIPGKGPGFAGGNFAVTRVRAEVLQPATKGPAARYVRLELPGKQKFLQLAEVQVFSGGENVAMKGEAKQSSTFMGAEAKRANDGNTTPQYEKGSVSHAEQSDDPWWEVDLKSMRALDRIVVWNRAEMGERLDGFRLVALDERRQPVWEKTGNKAAATVPFELTGGVEIVFSNAVADFTQADFDVAGVLTDGVKTKKQTTQKGWAIGGGTGKPHTLTLVTAKPAGLPAGSKLTVTIEMQSPFAAHNLGHFKISASGDARVAQHLSVPADVLAALATQADGKSRERILDYYVHEISPELKAEIAKTDSLRKQIAGLKPETVPVMRELPEGKGRKTRVQLRGNYLSLADEVSAGMPAIFHPPQPGAPMNRLTLARWLVDGKNPLTARVVANRYWETIFGIGIVRTSEEFGAQGEAPTHPELLDWLATELVARKWDMKAFLKLLVTSATYRQSSRVTPDAGERDPDNTLLARGPRIRLTAEMVRDQALAVGGLLSGKMFGPSVRPARPNAGLSAAFGGGLDWQPSAGEDRLRRGIYTEWRRTSPYPSMMTFDATSREICTIRRNHSNTPLQALVTLNDPVYVETAQALARRIAATGTAPAEKIRAAYRFVLQRPPAESEIARVTRLFTESRDYFAKDAKKATDMATLPIGPVPNGADVTELAAWTAVANVLLNLDETLMKR